MDLGRLLAEPAHLPRFVEMEEDSSVDLTPPPLTLAPSVAPVSLSTPPLSDSAVPQERLADIPRPWWRIPLYALAATAAAGIIALGASMAREANESAQTIPVVVHVAGPAPAPAAAPVAPPAVDPAATIPVLSVEDLPIVAEAYPAVSDESDVPVKQAEPERGASTAEATDSSRPESEEESTGNDRSAIEDQAESAREEAEGASVRQDPAPPAAPFDRAAARQAVASAAAAAASCRSQQVRPGDARVAVTFAPSGRVTTAELTSGPYLGTAVGGCVARTLRAARVQPFDGGLVTVNTTVHLR